MIRITVLAYGPLREKIEGLSHPYVELEEGATLLDLLAALTIEREGVLYPFVNGVKTSFQYTLRDGETIALLSPLSFKGPLFPVKELSAAIEVRTSRRDYLKEPLQEKDLEKIRELAGELESNSSRIEVLGEGGEDVFQGIIGSYGIIKNGRSCAVFIGKKKDPHSLEKSGYYGQALILGVTAMGLGSCWVAGFFKREGALKHLELRDGEEILAVTPIGYVDDYSFKEKLMRRMVRGHRRKKLEDLCSGLERDDWPPWMERGLELARLAPSALNHQPWRFLVAEDSITIEMDQRVIDPHSFKRLDCGIAMLHFELGARLFGVVGRWEHLPSPQVARFMVVDALQEEKY